MTVPNIKVKVVRKPSLKVKVLPRFPSSVTATDPILLTKSGGNYAFSFDVNALPASLATFFLPVSYDNFTQRGTGAVAYSLTSKIGQVFSARDYGCKGDGTTADAVNLNKAIAAVIALGVGELWIPAGTYKCDGTTILADLSAIATRFQGRIVIRGDGAATVIQNTTSAAACFKFLGNTANSESYFELRNIRFKGAATSGAALTGSKGIEIDVCAFAQVRGVIAEGFEYGHDCTDVEQLEFSNCEFRWNKNGGVFRGVGSVTDTNSVLITNCQYSNNALTGLTVNHGNAFVMNGGSIQYNGLVGGPSNTGGLFLQEFGTGYGTGLLSGVALEGNGGIGDVDSLQSTNPAVITFQSCSFIRTQTFGPTVGYGTNNINARGTNANTTYVLTGNTFRFFSGYTESASRPTIALANTNCKISDDGTNYFQSTTEKLTYPVAQLVSFGNLTVRGTLTISPPAASLNQAISATQTSPTSGSTVGPVLFNVIDVVDQGFTVTGSGNTFGMGQAQAIGSRVQYTTASTGLRGAFAGSVKAHVGAGSCYGICGSAYTSETVDGLWGNIGLLVLDSPASVNTAIALEGEVAVHTGATAAYRVAVGANSQGPVAGTTIDAAFMVSCGPNLGSAPFKKMFALAKNVFGSQAPLDTSADIFYADAAQTIANVFNFGNVTVTGNIMSFPNMAIGGAGNVVFGAGSASLPGSGVLITAPSSGSALLNGIPNGTTGFYGSTIKDSSTNNGMFNGVFEAGNTSTRFGQTAGNWAELITFGSTNAGLMVGTTTAMPLILGTNNIARVTISSIGDVAVLSGKITGPSGVAAVAYFVTPTGNDSNTGLTGAPCLTLQGAWNKAMLANNGSGGVTINVADGTYTAPLLISGAWAGAGPITIVGNNSTPANVLLSVTSANGIQVKNANITISGMEIRTTTAGDCLLAYDGGEISFSTMRFGACAGSHLTAQFGGRIHGIGSYTISGSAVSHLHAFARGYISLVGLTVTLTGTPAFSAYFAGVADASMGMSGVTFSGAATGKRFLSHDCGRIDTGGLGISGLPGSIAGTFDTWGQYDGVFSGTGDLAAGGAITTTSSSGLGYATGAGGTVTQITSKATAVTLNKISGLITMHNAALASGATATFAFNNSTIAVSDLVHVSIDNGIAATGTYNVVAEFVGGLGGGVAFISLKNISGGSLSEAVVIKFYVFKATST